MPARESQASRRFKSPTRLTDPSEPQSPRTDTKGADVNAKDFRDETPISYAVWEVHEDIVELLIGKGADVNQKNTDGYRVLDEAVRRGLKGIAEELLRAGAKCGTNPYSQVCIRKFGQN